MSLFPACMAESPTIDPHAPTISSEKQNLSWIVSILDSYSLPPPVQLIEGWFCWQMLCILHPESLWTSHFLPCRKKSTNIWVSLLLAWHPSRGKPGFGVTLGQSFDQNSYSSLLKLKADHTAQDHASSSSTSFWLSLWFLSNRKDLCVWT